MKYRQVQNDIEDFCNKLNEIIQYYPKKKPMKFGNVIFLPDAKRDGKGQAPQYDTLKKRRC